MAKEANGAKTEDDLGVGDEEETDDLLSLDPKEWKVCLVFLAVLVLISVFRPLETRLLCCPWSFAPSMESHSGADQDCAYVHPCFLQLCPSPNCYQIAKRFLSTILTKRSPRRPLRRIPCSSLRSTPMMMHFSSASQKRMRSCPTPKSVVSSTPWTLSSLNGRRSFLRPRSRHVSESYSPVTCIDARGSEQEI